MFIRASYSKEISIYLIILFGILFIPIALQAVMPPPYSDSAPTSPIKAIALVKRVKAFGDYDSKVTFIVEKSFGDKTVQEFEAICPTRNYSPAKPGMTGGTLSYSPKEGDRVLVTVNNSDHVSSYTKMSFELDNELENNGLKNISFSVGRASIIRKARQASPEMKANEMLKLGQKEWKKGKLNEALFYLEETVRLDPLNKRTTKIFKSMRIQKNRIDILLQNAIDSISRNDFNSAEKSLKNASLIQDKYLKYQEVNDQLTDARIKNNKKISTDTNLKRMALLMIASKKFQELAAKNYAKALLALTKDRGKLQLYNIDKALWDSDTSQFGWMTFFNSAVPIYNNSPDAFPIVGFYNPYSDVLLLTIWAENTNNHKIVDAEIIMGSFLHGEEISSISTPLWLQKKSNYKTALGLSVARTVFAFENTFSTIDYINWREKLKILHHQDIIEEFNYSSVSVMLNSHLLNILNYINLEKSDHKLIKINELVSKVIKLLTTGKFDEINTASMLITSETIKRLMEISPDCFEAIKISSYIPNENGYIVFLSPAMQANISISISINIQKNYQVEIDLIEFQNFYGLFKANIEKVQKGDL